MSFRETKISEFSQYRKSDKAPSIIYADLEFDLKSRLVNIFSVVIHCWQYDLFMTIWQYGIENNHDVYIGEDCTKFFGLLKRARNGDNQLWKGENDNIKKRRVLIIP